jgi:hypothetical protein
MPRDLADYTRAFDAKHGTQLYESMLRNGFPRMIENIKPIDSLQVADLQAHPVWQYTNREGADETFVRPVKEAPVDDLAGKIVGTEVMLANGQRVWALIGNVDPTNAKLTQHFLTLSVERGGRWFMLARYHDFDYAEKGPEVLADFLRLSVEDVFPVRYDIRQYVKGKADALSGDIPREPRERLSRAEIIAMAVP